MGIKNLVAKIILPKKQTVGGLSRTDTMPSGGGDVTAPSTRSHLIDLIDSRMNSTTSSYIQTLFKQDPDMSAAVGAYLTVANTDYTIVAYNEKGEVDPKGTQLAVSIADIIGSVQDYSQGFQLKRDLRAIAQELRYATLLRGGNAAELILDKQRLPFDIRPVDLSTIKWSEETSGVYKPRQEMNGTKIDLNIPTFVTNFYHRDPFSIYSESPFISAITSCVARMRIINDLYRIMQVNGMPRISLKVAEEVLIKNAPDSVKQNPNELYTWVRSQLQAIASDFSSVGANQIYVHMDSITPGIMNEKKVGTEINIDSVINTLNAQNQAGLKSVSSVLGRANSSVNSSSTETMVFSMSAEGLNHPVAATLSQLLTLAARLNGYPGRVEVSFAKIDLRPDLELEPQRTMRQSRLLRDLSLGLITDAEYHLKMYGRLAPAKSEELMGTGFFDAPKVTTDNASTNSDPLGRSVTAEGSDYAKSSTVK